MSFLFADLWLAWQYFAASDACILSIIVIGVVGCVTLLAWISLLYTWPILAIFDFPLKKVLSNSFIMAVGNLPSTITVLLLFAAAAVASFYLSGLFFFWFGLAVFFSAYFFVGVFKKYTGELAEEQLARKIARRERRTRLR